MSQPEPPLITPFAEPLNAAVEALYASFGEGHVSAQLEVCLCPVCMTEETRQQIIATPSRALTPALIAEYSNSAHGVPRDSDDLRLLLPRYLDLIAQDEMVDLARRWTVTIEDELAGQLGSTNDAQAMADFIYSTAANAKIGAENRQALEQRLDLLKRAVLGLAGKP